MSKNPNQFTLYLEDKSRDVVDLRAMADALGVRGPSAVVRCMLAAWRAQPEVVEAALRQAGLGKE